MSHNHNAAKRGTVRPQNGSGRIMGALRQALLLGLCMAACAFAFDAIPVVAAQSVLAGSVLTVLFLAVTNPGTGVLAATVVGSITESTTPTDHKVRDMDNRLTLVAPQANPLNRTLRMLRRGKKAMAEKVEWEEDITIPRETATTGVTTAGTADTAKQIPIANPGYYMLDDLLMLPNNATTANAQVIVTGFSGNDILVQRWDGGSNTTYGTVPALASGEKIIRMGNLKEEGYGFSSPRTTMPGQEYNYIEEVDASIDISTRRLNTKNFTIEDFRRSADRQGYDHAVSQEFKLFYGKREQKTILRNGVLVNVTSMGGINSYNIPKQLTYSAATLSQATIIQWHKTLFKGNNGSQIRYAYCDEDFAADLATVPLDQVRRQDFESKVLQFGVQKTTMAGLGTIVWIPNQMFAEAGKSRIAWILDIANCEWVPFQALDKTRQTKQQTGRNMVSVNISEAYSSKWRNLATHMLIQGTA